MSTTNGEKFIIIDADLRTRIAGWARRGVRLVCEFTDRGGRRCVSVGYLFGLTEHQIAIEACGRSTIVTLDRVTSLGPVLKGASS
jgi:hypothetical protein